MKNSNRLAILALSVLALATACEDDPVQPAADSSSLLTTRDAVLSNLEVAWDNRATDRIDDLLDDNFRFYFHPGDVGGSIPAEWGRAEEMGATEALFMSNTVPVPSGPVCTSVRLDLSLDDVDWVQIADTTSGETWHTTIVFYDFTFKMESDDTYLSAPGAKAQLTVREVAVGSGTEWRLVEWRDLGDNLVAGAEQSSVNASTWGAIKALYRNFLSPTTRDAVLRNLEAAWNERSTNMIDQLLDDDFMFFFAMGDVGGSIPSQWSRADELQTSHDLFVSNIQSIPTGPTCTSLHVDLVADNPQWVEIIPESYPAETWYTTMVFYSATFRMASNDTYIMQPGAKAQFTVRNVGSDVTPHYRLVEWRDLGNTLLTSKGMVTSTQESTWGGIKALYR